MDSKIEERDQEYLPDGDIDLQLHEFQTCLIAAKARVTPLKAGLTIPRSELSELLLCMRLMARVVKLYSGGFGSVSCLGTQHVIYPL